MHFPNELQADGSTLVHFENFLNFMNIFLCQQKKFYFIYYSTHPKVYDKPIFEDFTHIFSHLFSFLYSSYSFICLFLYFSFQLYFDSFYFYEVYEALLLFIFLIDMQYFTQEDFYFWVIESTSRSDLEKTFHGNQGIWYLFSSLSYLYCLAN